MNELPRRASVRLVRPLLALLLVCGAVGIAYWQWDRYRARDARTRAEEALARYDLASAAAHLDRYTSLRPDDASGWFQSARTARRLGNFSDAKRHLATSERLGWEVAPIRLERDLILVQQGIIGDLDARLRSTIDPDHPDVRFVLEALARGYVVVERWMDARDACELWRALEPNAPRAWLWAGWVSERTFQIAQAVEFYTRAHELARDDRDARVALARVFLGQRKPDVALPHYEWVLARYPDDSDAILGLAQCRIEGGRAAEAMPLIERVLVLDPGSVLAKSLRGRATFELGDAPASESWLREAVRADPSEAEPLHALVRCLRAQQKNAEADQLDTQLSALLRDLGRLTEALRQISSSRRDPGPCHEAGVIALRIGRTQQGVNLLNDALRRPGDHRATHAVLAEHFRRVGKPDLSKFHQNLAGRP